MTAAWGINWDTPWIVVLRDFQVFRKHSFVSLAFGSLFIVVADAVSCCRSTLVEQTPHSMSDTSPATATFTSGTHASSFSLTANDGTAGVGYFNGVTIGSSGQLSGTLGYTSYQILKTSNSLSSTLDTTNDTLTFSFHDINGIQTGTFTALNVHDYSALNGPSGSFTITVG